MEKKIINLVLKGNDLNIFNKVKELLGVNADTEVLRSCLSFRYKHILNEILENQIIRDIENK